jgi:hypothetical protein
LQSTKSWKINNQVKCINNHDYGQYDRWRSNSATLPFSTSLKSKETQRVNVNSVAFFPKVKGKFGTSDLKEWPMTIWMTEMGGMDDVEVRQYFLNMIVSVFPDLNDVNEKRVMVKVDSGPGRLQENPFC